MILIITMPYFINILLIQLTYFQPLFRLNLSYSLLTGFYLLFDILNIQLMEPSSQSQASSRILQTHQQILTGLSQYYKDRSKNQVWNKIFRVIDIYIGKEGSLSSQSQKHINFYLQNKSQNSNLSSFMIKNKQLICKLYDFCRIGAESVDQALSSGSLSQVVIKKLQKPFQQQGYSNPVVRVLNFCIEAVALHFCQFLIKFKQANGNSITLTNRKIPKILKRKWLHYSNDQTLLKQIVSEPVTLLEGFIDNIKPVLTNYLNMETLFQLVCKTFWSKKAFLCGTVSENEKKQFNGRIIYLNRIFDSSYTGRQMIQSKLSQLKLKQDCKTCQNHYWSLTTCLSEIEPKIHAIIQKLPIFLKPKSNGDLLSFCKKQFLPTFKYHVIRAGYQSKPLLAQYLEIFLNAGKSTFDIISFPYSFQVQESLSNVENYNIYEIVQKLNVKYSKIRVGPKSIGVVSSKNYYVICTDKDGKNKDVLNQIISWQTLPKHNQIVAQALSAREYKSKGLKNYLQLPIEQILLDFLNHEYIKTKDFQLLKVAKQHLQKQLKKQQDIVFEHLTKNKSIQLVQGTMNYAQRFCCECKHSFFNYSFKPHNKKDHLCMGCSISYIEKDKISEIFYFYNPKYLRYPLALTGLYISKKKHPAETIQNLYQQQVCDGQFLGAIQNQNCKGDQSKSMKNMSNCSVYTGRKEEIFYGNRLKEFKITTIEQILTNLGLTCPKNQDERISLIEKIRTYSKELKQPENFSRTISSKYDVKNMVYQILWECAVNRTYK